MLESFTISSVSKINSHIDRSEIVSGAGCNSSCTGSSMSLVWDGDTRDGKMSHSEKN